MTEEKSGHVRAASLRARSVAWAVVCMLAAVGLLPRVAAAHEAGTVVGWGANGAGAAQPPAGLDDVVAVAAGRVHSVALRADGTVEAWGDAFYGGRVPPGVSDISAVAASDTHTLYLRADGSVSGAGWNGYGALVPPANLGDAVAVAAGSGFSLALTADGRG